MNITVKAIALAVVSIVFNGGWLFLSGVPAATAADDSRLLASVRTIDERASRARESKKPLVVEDLRLERLALVRAAAGSKGTERCDWTHGYDAIVQADEDMQAMRYQQACKRLVEAWKPFANPRRGDPIFGDIAVKLFQVTQAAVAVHPDFLALEGSDAVSEEFLLKALKTAVERDPCQVEAAAMLAFLQQPKPEEAFLPADQRPSLRDRNRMLLDISPSQEVSWDYVPWAAPAEFLKAQSSSYVLDDLDFFTDFLNEERFRLQGVDRFGEQFQVVLGGALLLYVPEGGRSRRLAIARYQPDAKQWQKVRVQLLVAKPLDGGDQFVLDEEALLRRFWDAGRLMAGPASPALERAVRAEVEGLLDSFEGVVRAGAQQIMAKEEPLEVRLQALADGFRRYEEFKPEHQTAVRGAVLQVERMRQKYGGAQQVVAEAMGSLPNFAPEPPATTENTRSAASSAQAWASSRLRALHAILRLQRSLLQSNELDAFIKPLSTLTMLQHDRMVCPGVIESIAKEITECQGKITEIENAIDDYREKLKKGEKPDPLSWRHTEEERRRYEARRRECDELQGLLRRYKGLVDGVVSGDFVRISYGNLLEADNLLQRIQVMSRGSGQYGVARAFDDTGDIAVPGAERVDIEQVRAVETIGRLTRGKQPVGGRAFEGKNLRWAIYDLPDDVSSEIVARAVDFLPRLGVSPEVNLGRAFEQLESAGPAGVRLATVGELTEMSACPVGMVADGGRVWVAPSSTTQGLVGPCYIVVLVPEAQVESEEFSPAFAVDPSGAKFLRLRYGGEDIQFCFEEAATPPALEAMFPANVERPCIKGVVRLQVGPDARLVRDARGNSITRVMGVNADRFFRIVSESGQELSDRAVNYAKKDWRSLDRNIVNEFMPRVMLEQVSLPAWKSYRTELYRRSPDGSWLWALPRPAFAIDDEYWFKLPEFWRWP